MSSISAAAFRSKRDWLRRFLTGLLLLAFSAFVFLATAHASPGAHASHQDQTITGAQHDAHPHESDDRSEAADEQCCHTGTVPDRDCGQICTFAALLPEALPVMPPSDGEPSLRFQPSDSGRNPSGILRPPRLIATA
jgi:hypothetical protein